MEENNRKFVELIEDEYRSISELERHQREIKKLKNEKQNINKN